jgi:hypothetical protein
MANSITGTIETKAIRSDYIDALYIDEDNKAVEVDN